MNEIDKVKILDQLKKNQEIVLAKFDAELGQRSSLNKITYFSDKSNDVKGFKRKILVVENDNMNYTASNFTVNSRPFASCSRYYVGFFNKKSKKMRILNTAMYDLRPAVIGNLFGESKTTEKNKEMNVREELTLAFGSLKKQRALESKLKHQVAADNISKLMNKVIQDVQVSEPINIEINKQDSIFPPINREAVKVEDVYNMKDLIIFSSDHFDEWVTSSFVFKNATKENIQEWIAEKKYPLFVLNLLQKLPAETEFREERCKTLMYMNYLYQLLQLTAANLKSGKFLPDMPEMIKDVMMTNFFQISGAKSRLVGNIYKVMTSKQKDSCVAYIIVLMLLYNNYSFPSSDLMPDLKLSSIKFNSLVRAVGANIKKSNQKGVKSDIVTLTLPLTVLETRRSRAKP